MDAGGYDEHFKQWRYDDLPILPEPFRYVLAQGKEDAFENLRALMDRPDVDTIVNACDACLLDTSDVNYQLAKPDDQTAIFEALCDMYNAHDASIGMQLSLCLLYTS